MGIDETRSSVSKNVFAEEGSGEDTKVYPKWLQLLLNCVAISLAIFPNFGKKISCFKQKGETATVPARIRENHQQIVATVFGFFCGGSFFIMIYYLPIWLQAAKSVSAVQSGIRNWPLCFEVTIITIFQAP
jgi:hypothetical protein